MRKFKDMIKILIRTIALLWKSSKTYLIITAIISLFTGAFIPISVWIWKNIIDVITTLLDGAEEFNVLYFWLGMFLLVNLLNKIFSSLSEYALVIFSEHLDMNIKDLLLTKINTFELSDYDDSNVYNEIMKASNESSSRSLLTLQTLLQIVQNSASVLGTIALLLAFDTKIVLLCLISTIPMFYISLKVMDKLFDIFNLRYEKLRYSKTIESIIIKNENIKEIKIYGLGVFLKNKILNIYKKNLSEDKRIRAKITLQNVLVNALSMTLEVFIKILTIIMAINRHLSIGNITMYISSIDNLTLAISNILNLFSNMYENTLYMQSLFKLLDKEGVIKRELIFEEQLNIIEFKNVSFHYPGNTKVVLENVNIKLRANQTYALVGYNGAGKTTLIKLMLGLYEPTEGQILLNNVDARMYNKDSIYKQISAVFQDFIRYPFNVRENIGLGDIDCIESYSRIEDVAKNAGIHEYIQSLPNSYETQLSREWAESTDLSLGQWQKLAIARALMRNSSILVLDEPTASLDAVSEYELFKKFEIMKNKKLCVLVTHRLANIKMANEILVLDNNTISEQGTHDELMELNGIYKKLYSLQADMYKTKKKEEE